MAKNVSSRSIFNSSKTRSSMNVQRDSKCFCDVPSSGNNESGGSDEESKKEEADKKEERKRSLRNTILEESKEQAASYEEWLKEHSKIEKEDPGSPAHFLEREIFPILSTAMEKMLIKARSLDVLRMQKCRFNGLDFLAEYLWNKNSKWPIRNEWLDVYDIPQFKLCMRLHPRPIFPKSWHWSTEEAALRIQRYVRGWLVRKREDVQELRQFWKTIREEENLDLLEDSRKSKELDVCQRYKLLAKRREKPF